MKFIWMAVTADEYELPIFVEDTAEQLANKLGVTSHTVIASVARNNNGRYSGRKIVRVDADDD